MHKDSMLFIHRKLSYWAKTCDSLLFKFPYLSAAVLLLLETPIMILWASLTVALYGMLPIYTWAEVVNSFNACPVFFYKNKEPSGFSEQAKKICQKTEQGRGRYYYATLYSTNHRIPLYSAYGLDYHCMTKNIVERSKNGDWFIEPQVNLSFYSFKLQIVNLC